MNAGELISVYEVTDAGANASAEYDRSIDTERMSASVERIDLGIVEAECVHVSLPPPVWIVHHAAFAMERI